MNRGGHQGIGFSAGETEHEALIAGTLVLIAACIDAHRNVGGLRVQVVIDLHMLPVEAFLFIADVLDYCACCGL